MIFLQIERKSIYIYLVADMPTCLALSQGYNLEQKVSCTCFTTRIHNNFYNVFYADHLDSRTDSKTPKHSTPNKHIGTKFRFCFLSQVVAPFLRSESEQTCIILIFEKAVTCSHSQPLAATCSHLQPLAATCSHLQPLAATCHLEKKCFCRFYFFLKDCL